MRKNLCLLAISLLSLGKAFALPDYCPFLRASNELFPGSVGFHVYALQKILLSDTRLTPLPQNFRGETGKFGVKTEDLLSQFFALSGGNLLYRGGEVSSEEKKLIYTFYCLTKEERLRRRGVIPLQKEEDTFATTTITVLSPATLSRYKKGQVVPFRVRVDGTTPLLQVSLYLEDKLLKDLSPSLITQNEYTATWNTLFYSTGAYTFRIIAKGKEGDRLASTSTIVSVLKYESLLDNTASSTLTVTPAAPSTGDTDPATTTP